VPSPVEPFASTGVVREAIDPRRFPWIRPLTSDYADRFDALAALFAGNPADPGGVARHDNAGHRTPPRSAPRCRRRWPGTRAARRAGGSPQSAANSRSPPPVAIVTGQQAGLFGGPALYMLKAVTTVQLARHVRATYGVPAVPVFWVDTEDHDWAEVKSAHVLDRDGNVANVTAADVAGAGRLPIANLSLEASSSGGPSINWPTYYHRRNSRVMCWRRCVGAIRPAPASASACAAWIEDLLGRHGLVVFEADDPSVKPLAADLFARELGARRTAPLAREAGAMMARLGHAAQVEPAEDSVALFYLNWHARLPIRARGDQFQIGDDVRPARTSRPKPVSIRSVSVPTCYCVRWSRIGCFRRRVMSPGRQNSPTRPSWVASIANTTWMRRCSIPASAPRSSTPGAVRFFERSGLPLEALQPQDDSALNQLLARELPPGLDRAIDETDQLIRDRVAALKAAVVSVDPTLGGTVDTTVDRMRETMKGLHGKVVQAAKRKDDTLRRQFVRTRSLAFPEGHPQERYLSLVFFVNRYGPGAGRSPVGDVAARHR
jgi:hypothetical protein